MSHVALIYKTAAARPVWGQGPATLCPADRCTDEQGASEVDAVVETHTQLLRRTCGTTARVRVSPDDGNEGGRRPEQRQEKAEGPHPPEVKLPNRQVGWIPVASEGGRCRMPRPSGCAAGSGSGRGPLSSGRAAGCTRTDGKTAADMGWGWTRTRVPGQWSPASTAVPPRTWAGRARPRRRVAQPW